MTAKTSKRVLVSVALVLLTSGSALAADATAFAERLKAVAAKSSIPMSFTSAESSGDDVLIKGIFIGTGPEAAAVGDIPFKGVQGSTASGWTVASIPVPDVKKTEGDGTAEVTGIAIDNFRIAGTDGPSKLPGEGLYFFDKAAVASTAFTRDGKDVLTLSGTDMTNTVEGDGAISINFKLGDFKFDSTAVPQDEETKTLADLGYQQISGTGLVAGKWEPKSGELSLDPFKLSVANAGDFNIAYQINGYTPAVAASLQKIQEEMAANPEGAQSSGMAMLGLASQLSIAKLDIGFTDASLTGKLLDYYAKQGGQTRDQLIDGITGTLPGVLGALQNPAFQTEVTTAVETFLKDPKSIRISVDPTSPVPATQIIGAAMGAPQTLPSVLQLKVRANEATR